MERNRWEGRIIEGRFRLRQYLGGSTHSAVYLTEFGEGTPQKAAIKLAPADSGQAATWILQRELAARLSQPGLLPVFRFGTCRIDDAALVYAVMELSDEDLSQVIPVRPLEPAEARQMLMAVVETLAYVHGAGFVHGRLTPANIMAVGDRVKLSSDGLLRIGDSSDPLRPPNLYDPPKSRTGMTPAGDIWWLGITLVEVLTQRPPAWDGPGTGDPVVPETLEAPFADIARRCLRADRRSRCSLAEIARTLQPVASAPVRNKRKYLLPVMGTLIAGSIVVGAMLRVPRPASAPPATESQSPVPEESSAVQKKPEPVPAAPGGEILPEADKKPEAATPQTVTTPAAPAANTTSSAASPAAGDVVERFVPQAPAGYFATIRGSFTVRVRVRVDSSGAVTSADLDSPPVSRYFDRLAVEAARRWKFAPASDSAGHGAESTRLVRFEFSRDGCSASADGVGR